MNIRNFDLNLLRVFAVLERERNVSRAAETLGLTQPSISNALQRLRQQYNDPLFVRGGRAMEPTPLALAMTDPIHHALKLMEASLTLATGFDPASSKHVFNVAMSDVGEKVLLPVLTAHFVSAAPGIRIDAHRMATSTYPDALRTGTLDLVIGNVSLPEASFFQQHLFSDRYVCILAHDHPIADEPITLERFLSLEHVIATGGNAESVLHQHLAAHRLTRKVRLSVVHYHMAALVVAKTKLIATVPENTVRGIGGLRILPLPFDLPRAAVRQGWHRRVHVDPANKWLRSTVHALMTNDSQTH
jgi:DNA-binding transcriptional LysR family regulator